MSQKTGKKLGFVAALAMLIGSVVGIGIFFKNDGVTRAAEGNGTTVLLAWIIGGLISLFAAISFSEIGSMKTNRVSGLPAWAEKAGGKKFGYFTRFNYSFFYFGILAPIVGVFVSELFFQFLVSTHAINTVPDVWVHIVIGVVLTASTLALNFWSTYASGWVQTVSTVLKFIPLALAALIGLIMANTHNAGGSNGFDKGTFTFTGLLAGLPMVLFAYDAFLNVGSLTAKTKGGSKTISKIVIVGIISIIVLYSFIAISSILHNQGFIGGVFADSLPSGAKDGMTAFTFFFLFVSGYGVLNGMSAGTVAVFQENVETETFFGAKTLKKKFGTNKTTIIYTAMITSFWTLVFGIPAIVMNTDTIIDGFSNFPTLFFFAIYAMTILFYALKRNDVETKKINSKLYKVAAWSAIVSIGFVVLYQLFYGMTTGAFINAHESSHWGLFADGGFNSQNWHMAVIFLTLIPVFVGFPFLNAFLTKKFENNDVYIDTFATVNANK